jgi:hypothetical protein
MTGTFSAVTMTVRLAENGAGSSAVPNLAIRIRETDVAVMRSLGIREMAVFVGKVA